MGEARPARLADEDAEAGAGDRGGLAGHGLAEALTLKRRGQVGLTAGSEKARKEFHDTGSMQSLHGCLRVLEWGISFDIVDIVIVRRT